MSNLIIIITYELSAIIFLFGLYQRLGLKQDLEPEFNSFYFMRRSFSLSILIYLGFMLLVCWLYHYIQPQPIAITALIGLPGCLLMAGWLQWNFFRRYYRVSNVIKRLERLTPRERLLFLEKLPPRVFNQLPGDYRIVSGSSQFWFRS